jgi:ATP-dependent helicase/nuclease subunit A
LGTLTIYRASAGSGKTWTLTREYINLLIELPENFRHILAVTFTNKATGEMKARILAELDRITAGGDSEMLDDFVRRYKRSPEQIRERARRILDGILQDYSRFHVVTIDSFFQGVIRSFARELDLSAAYNVELDIEKVLSAAVDNLFRQLEQRRDLLSWMLAYTRARISEGKGWKLKDSIKGLGNELFKESFQQHGAVLAERIGDRKQLGKYQSRLYALQNAYLAGFRELGGQAMQYMGESGLSPEDFKGKANGVGGFFRSVAGGVKTKPTPAILKSLGNRDMWIAQGSGRKEELEAAYVTLNPVLAKMIRLYERDYTEFRTAETILRHSYILGILTDLSSEIYGYTDEQDIFLVSDSARFLREIMGENEAPFIYEKTGNYLEYFMIDEFQDTSGFQWDNFKPLLQESLAMNRKSMVVGDVKQSIYRWRNSDWEILGKEINLQFDPDQVSDKSLLQNWRSRERIIRFNNSFFTQAKDLVAARVVPGEAGAGDEARYREELSGTYSDVRQEIPADRDNEGGMVRIDFLGATGGSFREAAGRELPGRIEELLLAGMRQEDIAILVRKRADGQAISDLLLNHNNDPAKRVPQELNVISNESLYLLNSVVVKFIIAVMKYLVDPGDQVNFTEMVYLGSELGAGSRQGSGRLFLEAAGFFRDGSSLWQDAGGDEFGDLLERLQELRNLPLNELTEEIILRFGLNRQKDDISFLAAFQDVVLDYSRGTVNDISSFLEWWKENGLTRSLTLPEEQDAIRILTIHKAKGLQFRVVLVPYCNWKLDHELSPIIWCRPATTPFDGLPVVPVSYSSGLAETIFREQYYEERFRIHVDNLNLLYVAFTRAIDALYVMLPGQEDHKGEVKDVAGLAWSVLNTEELSGNFRETGENGTAIWQSGEPVRDAGMGRDYAVEHPAGQPAGQPAGHMLLDDYAATGSRGKLRMKAQEIDIFDHQVHVRLDQGKLMHRIFELIRTRDDVPRAVQTVVREGKLTERESAGMIERVIGLMDVPPAREWFDGSWLVRNEQDIVHPGGRILRPDRIMYRSGQAVVVDYKFGSGKSPQHAGQVSEYMKLLRGMGEEDIRGYLWYVSLGEVVSVED